MIILEDLNVKGMIKNRKLARRIQDASWGTFKTFVEYKALWKEKPFYLWTDGSLPVKHARTAMKQIRC